MTSPKRRRINCNITRILYSDPQPGTACLYCSQINSRPCRTENEVLLPDGAARRGTAPPGIQIVDKVRFVYAGCGVNALSGLRKFCKFNTLQNFRRPDKRSTSGSFAFAISLVWLLIIR
ncbi:hypothetical protein GFB20_08010 [Escherichia coli]|nr:hypothetical protein [Escherichia coli]